MVRQGLRLSGLLKVADVGDSLSPAERAFVLGRTVVADGFEPAPAQSACVVID